MRAGAGVSAGRESKKWKPESIHHLCYVFRRTPLAYAPVIISRRFIALFELKPIKDFFYSRSLVTENLESKLFHISLVNGYYTFYITINFYLI
jgi:hypothetical protein